MIGLTIGRRSKIKNYHYIVLARFTLDDSEIEALTSRDIPIGHQFFDAMDKKKCIREDCRVLMAGEDGTAKAG